MNFFLIRILDQLDIITYYYGLLGVTADVQIEKKKKLMTDFLLMTFARGKKKKKQKAREFLTLQPIELRASFSLAVDYATPAASARTEDTQSHLIKTLTKCRSYLHAKSPGHVVICDPAKPERDR